LVISIGNLKQLKNFKKFFSAKIICGASKTDYTGIFLYICANSRIEELVKNFLYR
jgi:hypothetical protein